MALCEISGECPFYQGKIAAPPADAEELKEQYCSTNNLHCARYMIAQSIGVDKTPDDLLPGDKTVAYAVIAANE